MLLQGLRLPATKNRQMATYILPGLKPFKKLRPDNSILDPDSGIQLTNTNPYIPIVPNSFLFNCSRFTRGCYKGSIIELNAFYANTCVLSFFSP